jgi:hypothetical protein
MTDENTAEVAKQPEEVMPDGLSFGQRQLWKRQHGGQKNAPASNPALSGGRPDRSKPMRVKFADRNRISFDNMDPDYVYRVVSDKDGRIEKMQTFGYEFVESDEPIGDYRVAEGSKMGSAVSKPVGGGITGYLMRTRKEFYDEDQKAKAGRVDATEAALKPAKSKEEYGPGLTND